MPKLKVVLVTGGLGYIGAHTCVALAEAGYRVLIVDNLSNSKRSVLDRLRELTGSAIDFHQADVRDRDALQAILAGRDVDAVLHFAGLKAVGESVEKPLLYYEHNVGGSIALLEVTRNLRIPRFVFSSSATVYGEPERLPIAEDHPLRPVNPYGKSKLIVEHLLADLASADSNFRHIALRYFNPVGAHPSGLIGEDPRGEPNNLFPYLARVAVGTLPALRIFGNDYDTRDGTGIRDFIHVMDLAHGHVAALQALQGEGRSLTLNLGTGRGYSVLEAVREFERACGHRIALQLVERRPGDVSASYADPSRAAVEIGWKARLGLEEMCRDAWRWQSMNPRGYP
ncbi:MAG TPA: UDP-glucose 4-epimerase GalE [Burkholderiales bacterium]|nr:UDP-glucose 4-epimerase GalE [Burkholderiales bacterium]